MNQDGTRDLRWWLIPRWVPWVPRFVMTWLAAGPVIGLVGGLVFGLVGGLGVGLGVGLVGGRAPGQPQQLRPLVFRHLFERDALAAGLVGGLSFGLMFGLSFGLVFGFVGRLGVGLGVGLVSGLVVGLAFLIVRALSLSIVENTSPLSPLASWRADRRFGLVGGLVGGLLGGLALSETWASSLAFLELACRQHLPVRLIRFLEDAHARGVLRTVGPVYQFRHARLQDHLAQHEQENAVISPARMRLGSTTSAP